MKILCLVLWILAAGHCPAQTSDVSVRDLKAGKIKEDNSFVYSLPYQKGRAYLLVQAYLSQMSHKGEYALDFKMRPGSKICAARSGLVVALREDSRKGGLKQKHLSEGNYVIIKHDDNSYANYWHLEYDGALVNVGDTIERGQVIALSGNTGYTAFPHLHFEVTSSFTPGVHQVPTRFKTKKGVRYLRPLRWYRSI